jgi:predicted metal-dependent hydrolase
VRLSLNECLEAPQPSLFLRGLEEFNRGEFIACHESLERLWMSEPHPMRQLCQGILQLGVALHHLRGQRYQSAVTLLKGARSYLEPFAPACMGVDISALLAGSASCLAEVRRLGPERLNEFDWSLVPTIETIGQGGMEHE